MIGKSPIRSTQGPGYRFDPPRVQAFSQLTMATVISVIT